MMPPRLPLPAELRQFLDRLEANPGSVVLIAIEWPREMQNFPRVGIAWFDSEARKRLKRALQGEKRRTRNSTERGR